MKGREYLMKPMVVKYENVERLDELKRHFWFSPRWRPIITMLGGFCHVDPRTSAGATSQSRPIRGPVDEDVNFDPVSLIEAILDEEENPDDIFHTMLLLGAECTGEVRHQVRETSGFKKIEREFWYKLMVLLLRERTEIFYYNVKKSFAACMIEDEDLLFPLIELLEEYMWYDPDRIINTICGITRNSPKAAEIIAADIALKEISFLAKDHYFSSIRGKPDEILGNIASASEKGARKIVKEAIPTLINGFGDEDEGEYAQEALCKIVDMSPTAAEIMAQELLSGLIAGLSDEIDSIRIRASVSLERIASASPKAARIVADRVFPKLIEILKNEDEDKYNRYRASYNLGRIAGASSITADMVADKLLPDLITMLRDEGDSIRGYIAESLGCISSASPKAAEIITRRALLLLIEMLEDKSRYVRWSIIESLGKISSASPSAAEIIVNKGLATIVARVGDGYYVAEALGQIASAYPKAVRTFGDELLKKLEDKDRGVQVNAAKALGEIATMSIETAEIFTQKALPVLIERLKDEDWSIPNRIIEILGKLASLSPKVVETIPRKTLFMLLDMIENKDSFSRFHAIRILGQIASASPEVAKMIAKEALTPIIGRLRDEDKSVRSEAIEVIGLIASKSLEATETIIDKVLPEIIESIEDKDWSIRHDAINFLGEISSTSQRAAKIVVNRGLATLVGRLGDGYHVAKVLGQIASASPKTAKRIKDEVLPKLIEKIKDKDIKCYAAKAIYEVAKAISEISITIANEVLEPLIGRLWDEDWYFCEIVAEAIYEICKGQKLCISRNIRISPSKLHSTRYCRIFRSHESSGDKYTVIQL